MIRQPKLLGFIAILALSSLLYSLTVFAENRALLIGVGKYELAAANLDGIDLDVDMMKKAAYVMGFPDDKTKILMDEEATLANVKEAMSTWLVDGVGKDDSVLIYFSGHGTSIPDENGDESDGSDEVLTLHDLGFVKKNGQRSLKGVLVDDVFNELIAAIPSDNVLVVIDACHSGTATKSLGFEIEDLNSKKSGVEKGQEKFFQYEDMPVITHSFATKSLPMEETNFVAISAAGDNEKAIATSRGSIFTQGVLAHVEERNREGKPPTPRSIYEATTKFIQNKLGTEGSAQLFHPQLNGDQALTDRPIQMNRITSGRGPTWTRVEEIVKGMTPLKISTNRKVFKKGQHLKVTVDVPVDGYLNVINIDAQDNPIIIFPNRYYQNNRVKAGKFTFPEKMGFALPAGEPFGPTLIVAYLTEKPSNLYATGEGQRDDSGNMLTTFPRMSAVDTRGFKAIVMKDDESAPKVYGGMLEVDIRR